MHDEQTNTRLADALSALPLAAPAESAWPRLEASLAQRLAARRRRTTWTRSLAAAVAVLALVPLLRLWSPAPAPVVVPDAAVATVAGTRDAKTDLIARNQSLQASLVAYGEPQDAGAALAAAELEDLIGMVDVQLSATADPDDSELLWRQRLALMQELASIRTQGDYRLARNDSPREDVVPANYVID